MEILYPKRKEIARDMPSKKIKIIASYDWSMRYALFEFAKFAVSKIHYNGESYSIEFDKVIAEPILCAL